MMKSTLLKELYWSSSTVVSDVRLGRSSGYSGDGE